jgi:hypothetical protein
MYVTCIIIIDTIIDTIIHHILTNYTNDAYILHTYIYTSKIIAGVKFVNKVKTLVGTEKEEMVIGSYPPSRYICVCVCVCMYVCMYE